MSSGRDHATIESEAKAAISGREGQIQRAVDGHESRFDKAFRAARWALRRWTLKHVWYRARLPFRRRRWTAENVQTTKDFAKDPAARMTSGPAIAFGEFSGAH